VCPLPQFWRSGRNGGFLPGRRGLPCTRVADAHASHGPLESIFTHPPRRRGETATEALRALARERTRERDYVRPPDAAPAGRRGRHAGTAGVGRRAAARAPALGDPDAAGTWTGGRSRVLERPGVAARAGRGVTIQRRGHAGQDGPRPRPRGAGARLGHGRIGLRLGLQLGRRWCAAASARGGGAAAAAAPPPGGWLAGGGGRLAVQDDARANRGEEGGPAAHAHRGAPARGGAAAGGRLRPALAAARTRRRPRRATPR
jgi:hypothetical protein